MKKTLYLAGITLLLCANYSCSDNQKHHFKTTQFEVVDIPLEAQGIYDWWLFPVSAVFTHLETTTQIKIYGIWNGERQYILRFTPTLPGEWTFESNSKDALLNGKKGTLSVSLPSDEQFTQNTNYHGFLKVSGNGRYFEYSDGTPFFLLAATNWSINTSRCGMGNNHDGPFYEYLEDRKSKKFTAILMSYLNGFGDADTILNGYRNEGGYPFPGDDLNHLNPDFMMSLDQRVKAIWENGLVTATNVTWFGKHNCFFDLESAKRISAYITNRYSAYNGLVSLTGEYQYALNDCGWTADQIKELGQLTQQYNPYNKPVSIHPSGRTDWPAPHNQQSSIAFHQDTWHDCNWLQTGQKVENMVNIIGRTWENRQLEPVKPVFVSESYYERALDPEHVYHTQWQAWTAFLSGSAGYGYGAFGMWQFYDPDDSFGEPGKIVHDVVPWREAINFGGAKRMEHVSSFLNTLPWWELVPHSQWLIVNGKENLLPSVEDITPPQCAAVPGSVYIIYIPRGNENNIIHLKNADKQNYLARWFDPRNGTVTLIGDVIVNGEWLIPERPAPSGEDWVLLLKRNDQ